MHTILANFPLQLQRCCRHHVRGRPGIIGLTLARRPLCPCERCVSLLPLIFRLLRSHFTIVQSASIYSKRTRRSLSQYDDYIKLQCEHHANVINVLMSSTLGLSLCPSRSVTMQPSRLLDYGRNILFITEFQVR